MKRFGLPAVIALCISATPVLSQTAPLTRGLVLGAHLTGAAIRVDDSDEDPESGAGLTLQAGWNFTPRFGAFLAASGVNIPGADLDEGDYTMGVGDLGLRYMLVSQTSRLAPYVDLSFSSVVLDFNDLNVRASGGGFGLGGGLNYFVSPRVGLGVDLRWTSNRLDTFESDGEEVETDNSLDVTTARFSIGGMFFPLGR